MKPPKVNTGFVANRLNYIFTEVMNLCVYAAVAIGTLYLVWVIMSRPSINPGLYSFLDKGGPVVLTVLTCGIPLLVLAAGIGRLVQWLSDI